ncbi:MAG: hypothetical protein JW759_07580 [Candidatus Coatesbacteria bacterium]|nr:hypothetical protein [Candidatus Coatesbacteria bacterium]
MIDPRTNYRFSRDDLLNVVVLTLFLFIAVSAIALADDKMLERSSMEEVLRSAMAESLKERVARICMDMSCEAPSISVTADLSEVLKALPEKLATQPTVRCHSVPCIAITSDNWRHLMDVCAKSDEGARRIALEVGLSRHENTMRLASASVKSTEDCFKLKVFRAKKGNEELSLNLCGVRMLFDPSQAYVIDVGDHRLGALFDGEGELRLEPPSDESRRMLGDFVSNLNEPLKVSRVFLSCPFNVASQEADQVVNMRRRIDELEKVSRRKLSKRASKSVEEFLRSCMKSTHPFNQEKAFEGLTPCKGYEHPQLVVETKELGVFGFCFAGERDIQAVVMTSPETGGVVSFWEKPGISRDWTIPYPKHYAFDVTWHPDQLRVAISCTVSVSGVKPGQDIRFRLNPLCKVRSCRINGEETSFTQGELALNDSVSSAIIYDYPPTSDEGFIELSAPKTALTGGEADASIEYTIDYYDTYAIEMLREGYWASFCEEGFTLGGFCTWYPFARFRAEPTSACTMDFRVVVPTGFTAVAQGYPEAPETVNDTTVWRYKADFPQTMPSIMVGRFEEFAEDEFEPKLVVFTRSGEAVGRMWLNAFSLVVGWAEKYCGKYPYKRFAMVEGTPGDVGAISWPTMLAMTQMVDAKYIWWMLSHEVSHQWWGDAATMLKTDDIWLHEGTAVFFNKLFCEDLRINRPLGTGSTKDMTAYTRKVEAKAPISAGFRMGPAFGGLSLFHVKGALIYHILRMATNNDGHFFETLKQCQAEAQKVGLTEDGLKSLFEKAIGHNLSGLFSLYVHSRELPDVQIKVTDVSTEGNHANVSLSAKITPGGHELPYPIDVFPKSGRAPYREVIFIGPDFGDYKIDVPFADISRIIGNPDAMLLVAQPEQEDVELYVAPE